MSGFWQDPPQLTNTFVGDPWLQACLQRLAGAEFDGWRDELTEFGAQAAGPIAALGREAEANPPRWSPYDAWGRRVDEIVVSRAWRDLADISAREGLVAIGYERRQGPLSRLLQFAKLYLFHPSSAVYTCPLAMTDGAARLLELHGDDALRRETLPRLLARDPARFWTSGQWMTERTGGSDVSRTETRAQRDGEHGFRLFGTKWFTSATTSQMAITLARIEEPDGRVVEGSRGLSAFYLETRDAQGRLRDIEIHRLKDKLGTRAVPTAELTLHGAPARLLGPAGGGVKTIASLINVTRAYNAICAAATMRRAVALATDYAQRRVAFGRTLAEQPLHAETVAAMEAECRGALALTLRLVELLGREETGAATADESSILRLLTPLAKLLTGKQAVAVVSEALEAFGGAGYVEDSGLPVLLRDAQVLPIWEGTTNVLSLDALRAIERQEALGPLLEDGRRRAAGHAALVESFDRLEQYACAESTNDDRERHAREFALALARTYTAALLVEHAAWAADRDDDPWRDALRRWLRRQESALAELLTGAPSLA